ncbi:C40 family peptidase [Spelaeicoccus albus]|nr:C40 family peptidase [Spelaeicoccus albus]
MPARPARTSLHRLVALIGATALISSVMAAPAWADPKYPSIGQIQQSKRQTAGKAGQVKALEAKLRTANDNLVAARTKAEIAAENFNAASSKLDQKQAAAARAQAKADQAESKAGKARKKVGSLAANAYRNGGMTPSMTLLLDDRGAANVLQRFNTIQHLGAQRDKVLTTAKAKKSVASQLQGQAKAAKQEQAKATAAKKSAAATAMRANAAAQAVVTKTQKTKQRTIVQLASLQETTVALEKKRQEGIEAERRARAERIAKAKAVAAAQKAAREKVAREQAAREKAAREKAAREEAAHERAQQRAAAKRKAARDHSSSSHRSHSSRTHHSSPDPAPERTHTVSHTVSHSAPVSHSSSGASQAMSFARSKVGTWYLWGGTGPRYDCSGLTQAAWASAGVTIPRTSGAQYVGLSRVPLSSMRPGDLIFYSSNGYSSGIHHVTMYLGGGMMVEAPHTGAQVRVVSVRYSGGIMPYVARP